MNNETLYVVVASGGKWEDTWDRNEVATFDLEAAESYIETARAKQDTRNKDFRSFTAAREEWYDKREPTKHEKRLIVPKWPAGLRESEITSEMRTERTKIQLKNKKIDERNNERLEEERNAYREFREDFFLALGYNKDDSFITDDYAYEEGVSYSIDVVNLLK